MQILAFTAVPLTTYHISLTGAVFSNNTWLTSTATLSVTYGQDVIAALIAGG